MHNRSVKKCASYLASNVILSVLITKRWRWRQKMRDDTSSLLPVIRLFMLKLNVSSKIKVVFNIGSIVMHLPMKYSYLAEFVFLR